MKSLTLLAVLCAGVSASPLLDRSAEGGDNEQYSGKRTPVVVERSTPTVVSTTVLDDLKYYAEWAAAAYCNSANTAGEEISCSANACPTVGSEDTSTVATFKGKLTDIEGFIATDASKELIVVSVRGSDSDANWVTDFIFPRVPCNLVSGCEVHAGFFEAYNEASSTILSAVEKAAKANPSYKLIVTGHSLGAAVATLAGAYLRKEGHANDIYTYGSPRVGNEAFANFVTAQAGGTYRVTHLDDPIPRLPPQLLGFHHTSPEFWLSTGTATTVDYTPAEIKVCLGTSNTKCNGGTSGLDMTAHNYYLEGIDAC